MSRAITPEKRRHAQAILERATHGLNAIDMPCVAVSWGEDATGQPDVLMVSDAPSIDGAYGILAMLVDAWREDRTSIEEVGSVEN